MKIVIVSAFYSAGMGYVENCLPKALASLGHEVHVLTSNLNVYGNEPDYDANYGSFLGPADQGSGIYEIDGYQVHRLNSGLFSGYVLIRGLAKQIRILAPDIVHSIEIASLNNFIISAITPFSRHKLFTESHQHLSVVKPYLKENGNYIKRAIYFLTRTFPTRISSLAVKKCYAISPDCAEVAHKYFGVPKSKIKIQTLGTDTDLFCPSTNPISISLIRKEFGFDDNEIICIYTGRFSNDKNPLLLAKAIDKLSKSGLPFRGLFIGDGPQLDDIKSIPSSKIIKFVRYQELPKYYKISDIAVWPKQESLSMLDASACGIPIVVTDKMGDMERVKGNGKVYRDGDFEDLSDVLVSLSSKEERRALGDYGREKMVRDYSWIRIAKNLIYDYNDGKNQ